LEHIASPKAALKFGKTEILSYKFSLLMNNCLNYNLQVPETFIELFFRSSLISASFARNTSSPGKFDFEKTCKFFLV